MFAEVFASFFVGFLSCLLLQIYRSTKEGEKSQGNKTTAPHTPELRGSPVISKTNSKHTSRAMSDNIALREILLTHENIKHNSMKSSSGDAGAFSPRLDNNTIDSPRSPSSPSRIQRRRRKSRSRSSIQSNSITKSDSTGSNAMFLNLNSDDDSNSNTPPLSKPSILKSPSSGVKIRPTVPKLDFSLPTPDRDSDDNEKSESVTDRSESENIKIKKKGHRRSLSSDSSAIKSLKRISLSGKLKRNKTKYVIESRQDIFKNALKTGWVRVKSHSFGEKHALWKKLFLIFCPEELYLMKSQEMQAPCHSHFTFKNSCITFLKQKPQRCDFTIFKEHDLTISMDRVCEEEEKLTLSLRGTDIHEWVSMFCKALKTKDVIVKSSTSPNLMELERKEILKVDSSNLMEQQIKRKLSADLSSQLSARMKIPIRTGFSESVYCCDPCKGKWEKMLMKLEAGVIHFYTSAQNTVNLEGIIYLANCEIIPLDRQQFPMPQDRFENAAELGINTLRIKQTKLADVMSVYSQSGSLLPGYFPGKSIDVQFHSSSILQASAEQLLKAVELNIVPLETLVPLTAQQRIAMYQCDYEALVSPRCPENSFNRNSSISDSFNIFLSRYFIELQHSESFLHEAKLFATRQIAELERPDFIDPLILEELDISTISYKLIDYTFTNFPDIPRRVIGEVEFHSVGSVQLVVKTSLNLNLLHTTLAAVSVSALCTISNLRGKFHVYIPEEIGSRYELFFAEIPHYDMEVDFKFTEKQFSVGTILPKLRNFFLDSARDVIRDRVVYPNKITGLFTFATSEPQFRIEQVGKDPTTVGSLNTIESFREVVSRFIDEILQLEKLDAIPEVFTIDCELCGFFSSGNVLHGHSGVKALVYHFQNGIDDDVSFSVDDVQILENSMFLNFSCTGTLKGSFWDHYDPDKGNITLSGSMNISCIYSEKGVALLKKVQFSWSAKTIVYLLSLPSNSYNDEDDDSTFLRSSGNHSKNNIFTE